MILDDINIESNQLVFKQNALFPIICFISGNNTFFQKTTTYNVY